MKKSTVIILALIGILFMREIKHAQRADDLHRQYASLEYDSYNAGFNACLGQF